MTDAQRIDMLAEFVSLAMNEDCTGVALSDDMEKVERWIAGYHWFFREARDRQCDDETREDMAEVERWWLARGAEDGAVTSGT